MTINKEMYTKEGSIITVKDISKSEKFPGMLSMTIVLNGKELRTDHLEKEKLIKFINDQEVNKKVAELKERKKFLEENKIFKLYHFTNINNLESILKNGILSKKELIKKDIIFIPSTIKPNRNSNDISLSISHINFDLLNKLSNHNRIFNTIVLVTNTNPLIMVGTEFANNTSSYSRIEITKDITKLFEGDRTYRDSNGLKHELPSFYPTNPNAEALVKEKIDPNDITEIIVLHNTDEKIKKKINNLAFDYGKNFYLVKEYWPRCDQKGI